MAVTFPVGTTLVVLVVVVKVTAVVESMIVGKDSVLPPVVGASLMVAEEEETAEELGKVVGIVTPAEEQIAAAPAIAPIGEMLISNTPYPNLGGGERNNLLCWSAGVVQEV